MVAKDIIDKINNMICEVKQENFIASFPNIINSLEYIYYNLDQDIKKISEKEQFLYSETISKKVIEFTQELVKKYIKIKYNKDIEIKCEDSYELSVARGGYDNKKDIITYSTLGLLLGTINKSGYIQTFLHETRHKIQHDAYREQQISEILKYPPHMIILAKEEAYSESKEQEFYLQNYNNLYYETDAEIFSIETLKQMLPDLLVTYIEYANKKGVQLNNQLKLKFEKICYIITKQAEELSNHSKSNNRIKSDIESESHGINPIESTYRLEESEIDKLIALDKYLKANPEIQFNFPIFKLIFNADKPKTYEEIQEDKKTLLQLFNQDKKQTSQIEKIYHCIIISDPILYLTDLIIHGEKDKIDIFIDKHPTIFYEYPEEIQEIIYNCKDEEISTILKNKYNSQKKK